jgi:hypothetical protein
MLYHTPTITKWKNFEVGAVIQFEMSTVDPIRPLLGIVYFTYFVCRVVLKDNITPGFWERISSRPQAKNTVKIYSVGAERRRFPQTLGPIHYSLSLVGLITDTSNLFFFKLILNKRTSCTIQKSVAALCDIVKHSLGLMLEQNVQEHDRGVAAR